MTNRSQQHLAVNENYSIRFEISNSPIFDSIRNEKNTIRTSLLQSALIHTVVTDRQTDSRQYCANSRPYAQQYDRLKTADVP